MLHLHSKRLRHSLDGGELGHVRNNSGVPKNSRSRHVRRDLFEELQPFPAKTEFEKHKAGDITARSGQAIDKALADRIGDGHEYNLRAVRDLL
jgi:hypothetical protein